MFDPRDADSTSTASSNGGGVLIVWPPPARTDSWDSIDFLDDDSRKEERDRTFGQPFQTRPSRSKQKVPYSKRVAKRRRKAMLAKQHKKIIKEALARKAREDKCGT